MKKAKAKCNCCPASLTILQGSTFFITPYAKKFAPKKCINDPKQSRLFMIGSVIDIDSSSYPNLDLDELKSKMMKMIICMKLTFSFAENRWFAEFC